MPRKASSDTTRKGLREEIFAAAPGLEAAEQLFETVDDILFCVKDRQRRYVAANSAFVRRSGLPHRSALLGRTAREIFPGPLAASYEQQDDEVFEQQASVRDRLEMITQPDGGFGWFLSQKVAVKSIAGQVIAAAGISRDLKTAASEDSQWGSLAEVLDRLHRDCAKPLRIESLAKQAGLSWSQFQRRVRSLTGLTPRQLLTKSRIENAADHLRTSSASLASIALACGFYDQASFSRQFHNATGLTPSEYRRAFQHG